MKTVFLKSETEVLQDLVEGCRKRDARCQKELYQKYSGPMFRLLYRYTGEKKQAEDLLQDGFINVFTHIPELKKDVPFEPWCKRIMINLALEWIRSKQRFSVLSLDSVSEFSEEDPEMLQAITANELLECIAMLPPGYRTVFNMYALEGYSHQEIGKELGISENTSRSQFFKSRQVLQQVVRSKMNIHEKEYGTN